MNFEFPEAVPEIPVSDLMEAVGYYRNAFGFTIDWVEKDLGLAGISRENCRLFLASSHFRKARGNVGPVLTWLNLNSRDEVGELFRQWSSTKVKLLSEPESKPWGLHEFTAADLDGNLFRVFYDFATVEREKAD